MKQSAAHGCIYAASTCVVGYVEHQSISAFHCLLTEDNLAIGRNWMLMLAFSVCIKTASAIRSWVLLGSLWMIIVCSSIFLRLKVVSV